MYDIVGPYSVYRAPPAEKSENLLFLLLSKRMLCRAAAIMPLLHTFRTTGLGGSRTGIFPHHLRAWLEKHHLIHQESVYTLGTNVIDMFLIASALLLLALVNITLN